MADFYLLQRTPQYGKRLIVSLKREQSIYKFSTTDTLLIRNHEKSFMNLQNELVEHQTVARPEGG
jgi:hypothetical protein